MFSKTEALFFFPFIPLIGIGRFSLGFHAHHTQSKWWDGGHWRFCMIDSAKYIWKLNLLKFYSGPKTFMQLSCFLKFYWNFLLPVLRIEKSSMTKLKKMVERVLILWKISRILYFLTGTIKHILTSHYLSCSAQHRTLLCKPTLTSVIPALQWEIQ